MHKRRRECTSLFKIDSYFEINLAFENFSESVKRKFIMLEPAGADSNVQNANLRK